MNMRTRKGLGTVVLWSALCVAVALLFAPNPSFAEAVEVDARSAHRAVWRFRSAGKTGGTAFAIGDRHFLTCAHIIKHYSGHGATEVFLDQHGSKDSRTLRVNWSHVALSLVHDIALFTTKETVNHYFALAQSSATEGETGLRAMGHPQGLPLEVALTALAQLPALQHQRVDHHLLVVAPHGAGKPPRVQPLDCIVAARPAVDEIADTEEAVARRIECEGVECVLEGVEVPVQIADDEVATAGTVRRVVRDWLVGPERARIVWGARVARHHRGLVVGARKGRYMSTSLIRSPFLERLHAGDRGYIEVNRTAFSGTGLV